MTETRFKDITDYWSEWIIISLFILVHTCLTFLLPVDTGCEKYVDQLLYISHKKNLKINGDVN